MSRRKQLKMLFMMFATAFALLGAYRITTYRHLIWENLTSRLEVAAADWYVPSVAASVQNYAGQSVQQELSYGLTGTVNAVYAKLMEDEDEAQTQYPAESEFPYEALIEETEESSGETTDEAEVSNASADGESSSETKSTFRMDKLYDFDYLLQNFYVVDATTSIDQSLLNVKKLLKEDLTIDTNGDGPKILIYHTHSQEGYADSTGTDESQTVVGVGSYLTEILENEYGIEVLHHKGQYDVDGREHAYSTAAPYIEQILEENPSIEVVIDLHRDGVGSATRLVTTMDGKQVAQVMFFNGLSYTTGQGSISYLKNPYIQQNLAFSLQLKIDAVQEYPGFTRPIYLKGYRYNMHFLPRSLLVEVGAQTNTIEEAKNAMPYLAKLLNDVLCEQE